jgi:hypothetical protein
MQGEPRTVGAGALDPDQCHGAERTQPGQQSRIAGLGGGELGDASVRPAVSITAAVLVSLWVSTPPTTSRVAAGLSVATAVSQMGSCVVATCCVIVGMTVLFSRPGSTHQPRERTKQ